MRSTTENQTLDEDQHENEFEIDKHNKIFERASNDNEHTHLAL